MSVSLNDAVAIDGLALPQQFSGAAYYIRNLTLALLQSRRSFKLKIICKPQHYSLFEADLQSGDQLITVPIKNRLQQLYFYEYGLRPLLIRENVDLFLATHYIVPPPHRYYRMITTFHDMGFLEFPQYYPLHKRLYFGKRIPMFIKRSDHLIAVSRYTARAVGKVLDMPLDKIKTIYPGIDHFNRQKIQPPGQINWQLPIMLAVNTFEKRKNIPRVIELFNQLKNQLGQLQLLLIGQKANDWPDIQGQIIRSPFQNDIHCLDQLSDNALTACYQNATFFVNMSSYEGFGFTPFEAIRQGLPAFLFENNLVSELLAENPYNFSTLDPNLWTRRITEAYHSQFPARANIPSLNQLTWENSAAKTVSLLESVLRPGPHHV